MDRLQNRISKMWSAHFTSILILLLNWSPGTNTEMIILLRTRDNWTAIEQSYTGHCRWWPEHGRSNRWLDWKQIVIIGVWWTAWKLRKAVGQDGNGAAPNFKHLVDLWEERMAIWYGKNFGGRCLRHDETNESAWLTRNRHWVSVRICYGLEFTCMMLNVWNAIVWWEAEESHVRCAGC